MQPINGLDYAVLAVVAAGTVLGYARGFVGQLVSFVGLFLAYVAAFAFYDDTAPWIRSLLNLSEHETYRKYAFLAEGLHLDTYVYNALAFGILLFGVKLGFSVAGRLLNWLAAAPGIKTVNKWSGAALGFVEAGLIALIAVHVMTVFPNDTAQRLLQTSMTAPYMLEHTPVVTDKLQEMWENRSERVKA
ncbi:CvpA family protein [Paenibacillus validus]|uniref:CvpA family protein n=1 Tax=Paenibacillus validus TaxID=44253 RepID=A0A7X2Z9S5_9BACL|nr:CvpA family protein [Paenibacillus validus]MUG70896.1 CvpA family protein [Paenibacillus validus]